MEFGEEHGRPLRRALLTSSPAVVKGVVGMRASMPGAVSRIAILSSGVGRWAGRPTNSVRILSIAQAGSTAPGMGATLGSSGLGNQTVVGSGRDVRARVVEFGMG